MIRPLCLQQSGRPPHRARAIAPSDCACAEIAGCSSVCGTQHNMRRGFDLDDDVIDDDEFNALYHCVPEGSTHSMCMYESYGVVARQAITCGRPIVHFNRGIPRKAPLIPLRGVTP